jgi:hypothetical protein
MASRDARKGGDSGGAKVVGNPTNAGRYGVARGDILVVE